MDAESTSLPPVNSAVASILDSVNGPTGPGRPVGTVKRAGLSMTPEAIRMRERRAKAKQQPGFRPTGETVTARADAPPVQMTEAPAPSAPAGDRMTPSHLQLVPDGPSRPTVTPERYEKAVRDWTKVFQGAGLVAAKILFKSDALKVDEQDARDCAEALLDGWPELIEESSATFRQIMAVTVIASVGSQRWDAYKAEKTAGRPAQPEKRPVAAAAARADSVLPMMPVSM